MDTLKPYTYLLINLLTVLGPLALSFDKKVAYHRYWLHLAPGVFLIATFFIIWDILFTQSGVWSFNYQYLIGINIYNLPLEECLFFLTIPFSCLFIYIIFRTRWPMDNSSGTAGKFFLFLTILFACIAIISFSKLYTFVTAVFSAIISIIYYFIFKGRFVKVISVTYLIHLIPFLVVNGILTAMPVVLYNDNENCGFRIHTIPVEDTMYSFVLLMMNITIFEWSEKRRVQA